MKQKLKLVCRVHDICILTAIINHVGVVDAHDFIFWCGDLNYRLELDKKKAEEYISKSDWTVRRRGIH